MIPRRAHEAIALGRGISIVHSSGICRDNLTTLPMSHGVSGGFFSCHHERTTTERKAHNFRNLSPADSVPETIITWCEKHDRVNESHLDADVATLMG